MTDEAEHETPDIDDGEYRRVVEEALDVLGMGVVIARDAQILYASPTHLDLVGYTLEEMRAVNALEFVEVEQRTEIEERLDARRRGEESSAPYDVHVRHGSGRRVDIQVANVALSDSSPLDLFTLTRDVTEERAMQRREQQSHRMEAVGHFCAGVVHDFNNYLTAVRLVGEALGTSDDEREREELLAELESITAGAARLTHQLQTFAGGDSALSDVVDVNIVVFEMSAMLKRVTGAHVELVLTLEPGLPFSEINEAQLEQVIANLVINASQAIPDGGRVVVRTSAAEDGVLIEVVDSGCGMEPQTLERAFEPRFTTHPHTGSGMGLSIVYGIAQQCGATVEIESVVGEGSAVRLCLPVARRRATPGRPAPTVADETPSEASVLLVESHTHVGALTAAGLRKCGFDVTRVDIERAAESVGARAYRALVVDAAPPADPAELVANFRQKCPGSAVVFVSDPPVALDAERESGAIQSVPKPFSAAEIAAAIRGPQDGG